MTRLFSIFVLALSFNLAQASAMQTSNRIDDSDLSGPDHFHALDVPSELSPDQTESTPGSTPLSLTITRMDHGRETPVRELSMNFSSSSGSVRLVTDALGKIQLPATFRCDQTEVDADLANENFQIKNGQDRHIFKLVAKVPCTGATTLLFKPDSDAGQALGIWQAAVRARSALKASIGLSFWHSKITFLWPSVGDFYVGGEVNLTRGDYWDVVNHEMGHAIYDQGGLGRFGSGAHKIDGCYSKTLALSEGWASFFSAWVNVDLADPDAKFEYMVPRRAPIRFETIPDDVCKGETSEWRVIGFFWDLVDSHDDGERMNESFARLWNMLKGSHISSASEAMGRMKAAGVDADGLRTVWNLNFQSPSPF